MNGAEWLSSIDPRLMLERVAPRYYPNGGAILPMGSISCRISERQLRLFAAACWRCEPLRPGIEGFELAVSELEEFADGERKDFSSRSLAFIPTHKDTMGLLGSLSLDLWGQASGDGHPKLAAQQRRRKQAAALLRDIVGNPFKRSACLCGEKERSSSGGKCSCVSYRTRQVLDLAEAAYQQRLPNGQLDPFRLALVGESLEDEGLENEVLLMNLRGHETCSYCMLPSPEEAEYGGGAYWCPGCGGSDEGPYPYWMPSNRPRYRGFHALDLVIGKE